MANIMFKRGLQKDIPLTNATDGVFYLTTDTNRLYVGTSAKKAELLNQTVRFVNSYSELPTSSVAENDFYYCKEENLLATYIGGTWKQINPDHNEAFKITKATVANPTINTTDKKITYTVTLDQQKINLKSNTPIADTKESTNFDLAFTADDLLKILPTTASVGLKVEKGDSSVAIKTQGAGSNDQQSVAIKGADNGNVTVEVNNGAIVLDAVDTTYDLSVAAETQGTETTAKVNLKNLLAETDDIISFKAGAGLNLNVANNTVTYTHKTVEQDATLNEEIKVLDYENPFLIIEEIDVDDHGHMTGAVVGQYQLPAPPTDEYVNKVTQDGWSATLYRGATDASNGTQTAKIDFSDAAQALTNALNNKISTELAKHNTALTYRGTISKESDLTAKSNSGTVKVGDVYLFDAVSGDYKVGDMAIATFSGQIPATGLIPAGQVTWTLVPSGDELNTDTLVYGTIDSTYVNQVTYKLNTTQLDATTGVQVSLPSEHKDFTIAAGSGLTLSTSGSKSTIEHAPIEISATPTPESVNGASSFTAVTGVTFDANNHVSGITKSTFTPVAYKLTTSGNNLTLANATSNAAITNISFNGDSWISATATNNGIAFAHSNPEAEEAVTKSGTATDTVLSAGSSFSILSGITYDKKGHIVDASTTTLTLPADKDTTYSMYLGGTNAATAAVTAATSNPWLIFNQNGSNVKSAFNLKGADTSCVVVQSNATGDAIEFSLEWGTFGPEWD